MVGLARSRFGGARFRVCLARDTILCVGLCEDYVAVSARGGLSCGCFCTADYGAEVRMVLAVGFGSLFYSDLCASRDVGEID